MSDALMRAMAYGYEANRVMRIVAAPNPALGAEFSFTVPGQAIWRPLSLVATLAVDAAANPATPIIEYTDGSVVFARGLAGIAAPAAASTVYSFLPGNAFVAAAIVGTDAFGFIPPIVLPGGSIIRSATDQMAGADQWSAIVLTVEELLTQPPGTREARLAWLDQFEIATEAAAMVAP